MVELDNSLDYWILPNRDIKMVIRCNGAREEVIVPFKVLPLSSTKASKYAPFVNDYAEMYFANRRVGMYSVQYRGVHN